MRSSRILATSRLRLAIATSRGVLLLLLRALRSAPDSSNSFTISRCPLCAAWCNGVQPDSFRVTGFEPRWSSNRTTSRWPLRDALSKGVSPIDGPVFYFRASLDQQGCNPVMSIEGSKMQWRRRSRSRAFTSAPRLSNSWTTSRCPRSDAAINGVRP
jgi:hypothetical protein